MFSLLSIVNSDLSFMGQGEHHPLGLAISAIDAGKPGFLAYIPSKESL
jgi:hypothetical protein